MRRRISSVDSPANSVRVVAKGQDPYSMRADQVMSSEVATIDPGAPLAEAAMLMERRQLRRLMVVDAQGRLQGMLAQADIAEAIPARQAGRLVQEISEPEGDRR